MQLRNNKREEVIHFLSAEEEEEENIFHIGHEYKTATGIHSASSELFQKSPGCLIIVIIFIKAEKTLFQSINKTLEGNLGFLSITNHQSKYSNARTAQVWETKNKIIKK